MRFVQSSSVIHFAIEPLSLDEAYLDVKENKTGMPTATLVAKAIRQQIREELNLTASAGVAPNKFLAKIASDWRKPNGLFVIQPHEAQTFLLTLPVGRIPGVGKVTEARMAHVGIKTVGDVYAMDVPRWSSTSAATACASTNWPVALTTPPVISNRYAKQVSAEDTFPDDIPLAECEAHVRRLAEKIWNASKGNARQARTVVLKLKTKEFSSVTRSLTPRTPIASCEDLTYISRLRCESVSICRRSNSTVSSAWD